MGPTRTSPSARHASNPMGQPPRPPNAWILYRSDKLKTLTPPPAGTPRRPQADISKTISLMWKSEPAEVRSHYERLSDIKKAEHQAMYPGYRFQPVKKADRERIRIEQRLEKEREKERAGGPKKPKRKSGTHPVQSPPDHSFTPSSPAPSPSAFTHYPHFTFSNSPQIPDLGPATEPTPPLAQPLDQWAAPSFPEFDASTFSLWASPLSQDQSHVTINYNDFQPPLGWSPDDDNIPVNAPLLGSDALHAQIIPTADPSVFELSGLNADHLLSYPEGEIELSMGTGFPMSQLIDFNAFANLFAVLDNTTLLDGQDTFGDDSSPLAYQEPTNNDLLTDMWSFDAPGRSPVDDKTGILNGSGAYSLAVSPSDLLSQHSSPALVQTPQLQPASQPTPPKPSSTRVVSNAPSPASTSYTPPSGAALASSRRVAATWTAQASS